MGDTFVETDDYEGNYDFAPEMPVHEVRVDDFYLGKYPVTVGKFREFVNDTCYKTEVERNGGMDVPSFWRPKKDISKYWDNPGFSQTDKHPVVGVSWNDAEEFVKWKCEKTGLMYRLPTEAEWEYAAKSCGKKEEWSGTDNEGSLCEFAWYEDNSGKKTHPVGQKKPNKLGLYDMTGNVWEWVEDDWHNSYINAPKDGSAWINKPRGSYRVFRGGSWGNYARSCRSSIRTSDSPSYDSGYIGFRLVLPQAIRDQ